MASWMIWAAGTLYAFAAFDLIRSGNLSMGVSFIAYAIANMALGVATWR